MCLLISVFFLIFSLVEASDLEFEQEAFFLLQREISKQPGKRSSLQVTPAQVEHYWPSRGRDPATSSSAPYTAPSNFSAGPSWVWKNDLNEQVRHSPLIDADKNVFVVTTTRVRKFSSDGDVLWTWQADSNLTMNVCPVLYGNSIVALVAAKTNDYRDPALVSLDIKTGAEEWRQVLKGKTSNGDAQALSLYNDTVYFGSKTNIGSGSDTVVAVNASNGKSMWDYVADSVLWNFAPAIDKEGLIFSGTCGSVYRLSTEGKLLWKAGPNRSGEMCGPTGGALGPNGVFYAEYNEDSSSIEVLAHKTGKLVAYNVTDGSVLWKKSLDYRAAQYPAVGKLGLEGPLAVLVPMGDQPMLPVPKLEDAALMKKHGGPYRNMVLALDAETGAPLWQSEDRQYNSVFGAGEMDKHNPVDGPVCWPDAQGIPLVAGDGTVYTSSSHHGDLTAIRDLDGDGIISPTEVSVFKTGKCFLNSPSIAPGMLVAAPCWGPVYVFKS